ncbi:hypothetical protein RR46_09754 [Papilio xuthus]|uniref:Uncharacterized protein n=1 Tax=Papilio xuthus TaxID=66420 RepID=A0A194QGH6_PAPXU|nr:hypothetical protein RR46_09754 [Papilio xuthus]
MILQSSRTRLSKSVIARRRCTAPSSLNSYSRDAHAQHPGHEQNAHVLRTESHAPGQNYCRLSSMFWYKPV